MVIQKEAPMNSILVFFFFFSLDCVPLLLELSLTFGDAINESSFLGILLTLWLNNKTVYSKQNSVLPVLAFILCGYVNIRDALWNISPSISYNRKVEKGCVFIVKNSYLFSRECQSSAWHSNESGWTLQAENSSWKWQRSGDIWCLWPWKLQINTSFPFVLEPKKLLVFDMAINLSGMWRSAV